MTSFVIGQRISRRRRDHQARLAERLGDRPTVAGDEIPAFPRPTGSSSCARRKGLNAEKVRRLHGLATAAIEGRLDTETLRSMPEAEPSPRSTLPGVGPFTAKPSSSGDAAWPTASRAATTSGAR